MEDIPRAGSYPALVLSGFRPSAVLKGSFASSRSGAVLRKTLVVFQFATAIALIVGTLVVRHQNFDALYRSEDRFAALFGTFAALAIFVACLGLFGLAAFSAQQRTKEIGVRKVMGATVGSVTGLLSKEFLKLVLIGFVLAVPAAYFAMSRWLEGFAYRIELGWDIFLLAGLITLLIALATVSYQAVKAAMADPVKSLRYE